MNFDEFCESNKNLTTKCATNKFEKINKNLQNNNKNIQKNAKNEHYFNNFSQHDGYDKQSNTINFDENEIRNKIEKYKNMNHNELLAELLKESNKQKQNGNLDNEKLEDIKNTMADFMTPDQQSRLNEIIKMLRWYDY